MTPAQLKALQDQQAAVEAYVNGKPQQVTTQDLGASAMDNVSTDPAYKDHELAALRELENESKTGMTAQDRADMAQAEGGANRANRGRIGAIQQNMQARGAGGTGMDLVAQMQSSQDANELEAMKALEHEGMAQDRRSQATQSLGNMSSQLQGRDFAQQQAKAQAADQIAQFNNQNRNSAQRANVGAANDFAGNTLNAKTGLATTNYNAATEDENRRLLAIQQKKAADAAKKKAMGTMIGTGVGAVAGSFGGPGGTALGASAGGALGGAVAGMAHGGLVPGHAKHPGDDPRNDTVPTNLSPGEEVIPRSKVDAIGDLLDAVARIHKSKG